MIYFLSVNYFSTELVARLISSIQASTSIACQIVIINNSSGDSIHQFKSESIEVIEAGTNLGFGGACNLGLKWIYAQNPQAIVWIINPDAYLLESVLEKLIPFFEAHSQVSIIGTIIYTPTGEVWFAGGYFIPQTGEIFTSVSTNSDKAYTACDWVSGCSLLINLCHFPTCPQFDPAYFLYYEDFDFCRRYANLGHLIGVTKELGVIHQPSAITNRNLFLKFKHSTYSYLITMEKYTSKLILVLRLTKLIIHGLILISIKPQVAFGKLYGVLLYLRRSLASCQIRY